MRTVASSRFLCLWAAAALVAAASACSAGSPEPAPAESPKSVQQTGDASASTPVQASKEAHSDWLVLQTAFGLETYRVESGLSSKVVSKLDHDPHDASWSREADRLVWVGYDDDMTQDVWVADSRGQHARVLYDCAAPCKRAWWPRLSPDGSRVAVNLDLEQRSQHLVVDVTTGDAVTLDLSGRVFDISDWSADGRHLLGTLMTLTGPDSVADRRSIASLALSDIRPGSKQQPRVLVTADVPVWGAVWSPDGSKIAYVQGRDREGSTSDLYIVDADGSSAHQAWRASAGNPIGFPAWSSDGRHVFVSHALSPRQVVLAQVDTSTGTLTDLKDPLGNLPTANQLDGG